jgi:hypothetical protein
MNRPNVLRGEPRVDVGFSVVLNKAGVHFLPQEGVTMNLSQNGALIRIDSQMEFKTHDSVMLTLSIPTSFSGHDSTVFLRGTGVIMRVDRAKRAIATQFDRSLKTFKPIHETR